MGLSVWNQCNTDKYFSISTIDKKKMDKAGVKMTIVQLREIARRTNPYAKILTGSNRCLGQHRMTNIYRYEDFVNVQWGDTMK